MVSKRGNEQVSGSSPLVGSPWSLYLRPAMSPDKCLIRVMHRGVTYATIRSSEVGYDESLELTAKTASSAGEEGLSLVPEGPTRHGRLWRWL